MAIRPPSLNTGVMTKVAERWRWVALVTVAGCSSGPTPETCPTGHWGTEPIYEQVKTGETCQRQTKSTPRYDSKGNYQGADTTTENICLATYSRGRQVGSRKAWICPALANASARPTGPPKPPPPPPPRPPPKTTCKTSIECKLGETCVEEPDAEPKCVVKECKTASDCPTLGRWIGECVSGAAMRADPSKKYCWQHDKDANYDFNHWDPEPHVSQVKITKGSNGCGLPDWPDGEVTNETMSVTTARMGRQIATFDGPLNDFLLRGATGRTVDGELHYRIIENQGEMRHTDMKPRTN
jgi:hypothetical protein